MSASEFAFLAIGLLLGAASGAALMEVIRARPPAPRQVRVTMATESVPRRPATLAVSAFLADTDLTETEVAADQPWVEPTADTGRRRIAAGSAGLVPATVRRSPLGPAPVAIAIESEPDPMLEAIRTGPQPALAMAGIAVAAGMADAAGTVTPGSDVGGAGARASADSTGPDGSGEAGRAAAAEAGRTVDAPATDDPATRSPTGPCADQQRLVTERCEIADRAGDRAIEAADRLRAAKRAYDEHTARAEAAQQAADPRAVQRAKDEAQAAFHGARAAARTPGDTEAAASAWLQEINRINADARDAALTLTREREAAAALVLAIERLEAEADAARIGAETAREACLRAREDLARCQELVAAGGAGTVVERTPEAAPRPAPAGRVLPDVPLPRETPLVLASAGAASEPTEGSDDAPAGDASAWQSPVVLRILRGDHEALARVAGQLAAGDPAALARWELLLDQLVDAVAARAIEESLLDVNAEHPFWSLFTLQQNREIVAALASLGYRFDGLGGFADGRVPSQRDLSLAVGYAGLDPMRIRRWPSEAEMVELFADTVVAADEYLSAVAPDLTLSELVTALGRRADELAELWNAWGQARPLLIAPG